MIVTGHAHGLFGSHGIAETFSLAQGVSFFFVLSGFILSYNYPHVERNLSGFYQARFARLWPLHIAALFLLPILTRTWNIGGLDPLGVVYVLIGNALLIQSWVPFRDSYLTFNGVAWSISTEAAFYVAFPLAAYVIRKSWFLALAFCAALTLFFMWIVVHFSIPMDVGVPTLNAMGIIYTNPLARLFEFVLGMVACRAFMALPHNRFTSAIWWTMLEIALVVATLAALHLTPRFPLWHFIPPAYIAVVQYYLVSAGSSLVIAAVIVVFGVGRGLISRVLSHPGFVFLGESSFALYLVHATILVFFEQHTTIPRTFLGAAAFWIASLSIAAVMHLAIERPARSLILRQFRRRAAT